MCYCLLAFDLSLYLFLHLQAMISCKICKEIVFVTSPLKADQIKMDAAVYTQQCCSARAQVVVLYCLSFKCDICVIAHNHSRRLQPRRWLRRHVIK